MSGGTVISIGSFDAVHLGHQMLIARARALAGSDGAVLIYAFDPHPSALLRPGSEPPRLTTFEDRMQLLRQAGVTEVRRLEPTPSLLNQEPREFIQHLVMQHHPTAFVEGCDFRFGRQKSGTISTMRDLGSEFGFKVDCPEAREAALCDLSLVRVSSTLIRRLLTLGRVADAALLLGRPYHLSGRVTRGDQRGRTIGIPTANLETATMLPGDGVYAGVAWTPDGQRFPAAINIGVRPTFAARGRTCEVHLVGWQGPIGAYGWNLRVEFHAFVREEMRFSGPATAAAQIKRDIHRIQELMNPGMEQRCA